MTTSQVWYRHISGSSHLVMSYFSQSFHMTKGWYTARMQRRTLTLFLFILVLAGCTIYIDWPNNPGLHIGWLGIHHPLAVKLGLDLQEKTWTRGKSASVSRNKRDARKSISR